MRFTLDDLQRTIPFGFSTGSSQPKQLDEHEDLLKRRAQLVGNIRQKSLSRAYETKLAAEQGKAGDREHDTSGKQQQRCGDARLRNAAGDQILRHVRAERD